MVRGTVKSFNSESACAVVSADGGGDLFVDSSSIEGTPWLNEGEMVEFDLSPGGNEALRVRLV